MCGKFHKKLIEYLKLSLEEHADVKKEIDSTTTELETILHLKINYEKLIISLKSGFENHLNISFKQEKEFEFIS